MGKRAFIVAAALFVAACSANGIEPANRTVSYFNDSRSTSTAGSVTYQANAVHTGYVEATLRPPLTEVWAVNLGNYFGAVGYPVVANGIVVVAADGKLVALDAGSGKIRWSQQAYGKHSGGSWVGPAYDNGMIFSDPLDTDYGKRDRAMYAFDERSGKLVWSADAPREWAFSSPPTAVSGTVYTVGAGDGGEVYAYAEADGKLKWQAYPLGGDDSSPAVTAHDLYVSFSCPQTYDYNPGNGKQIWHYNGSCDGGGGSTPVYYDGLIFVEDAQITSAYNGLIFTATNGKIVGRFNAYFTPAFANHRGYFVTDYGATMEAAEVPSMKQSWSVASSSDRYVTPPLIVGSTVYIETTGGVLFGYDGKTGKQVVEMNLGGYGNYPRATLGLGYGSGELIVPDGPELIALKGS